MGLAILVSGYAIPSLAEGQPKPFSQFTFKSVKPPKPGEKPKIDVQIAILPDKPVKGPEAPVELPKPDSPKSRLANYAWYWQTVSPAIEHASAARINDAVSALRGPEGQIVPTPRLAAMQEVVTRYSNHLMIETVGTQVSPALALAVMWVESNGSVKAVSRSGAQGLMQLMPATAERFGVADSFDAAQNIRGGVKYLDFLLKTFSGDPVLTLAGYNAGENAVLRAQGVPDYAETRDYVPKVLAAFSVAKGLCQTPPVYVTDGCVFRNFTN
ncbi:transglycosylase SLT domain-containing protein [Donghicola sp. B5-SW-15]|uniref:Transglycosylase SLT domain-containing protein n=1 Tax=Donghicola mangrovi TaxID=2729614 RepID=A0A850QDP4_9RHOB|nr:transglycosylase SLT domain-containing protein [Donghicola mangrovi]NVO24269.1 transglycosylase SLT domain-containing protein [Donghicola mangrovi]